MSQSCIGTSQSPIVTSQSTGFGSGVPHCEVTESHDGITVLHCDVAEFHCDVTKSPYCDAPLPRSHVTESIQKPQKNLIVTPEIICEVKQPYIDISEPHCDIIELHCDIREPYYDVTELLFGISVHH